MSAFLRMLHIDSNGSIECLTQNLHCVLEQDTLIRLVLVQVQPRKTCPDITERLLMGHKESTQTKKICSNVLQTIYYHGSKD